VWAQDSVTVIVDGAPRRVATHAVTVADVLSESGVSFSEEDVVSPAPEGEVRDGMTVVVRHAIPVTVTMGADKVQLDVVGTRVADALVAAGVDPANAEHVSPPVSASLKPGMTIDVPDIVVHVEREESPVKPAVRRVSDASLAKGRKRVIEHGRPGTLLRVYRVVVADGVETPPVLTAEQVVVAPKPKVIAVGTGTDGSGGGSDAATPAAGETRVAAMPAGGRRMAVTATGYSAQQRGRHRRRRRWRPHRPVLRHRCRGHSLGPAARDHQHPGLEMPTSPLASPSATIAVLERHGLYTKKSLGQHFLIDDNTVRRTLELARLDGTETVLEVGPGIGTLTVALCDVASAVVAVERDDALLSALAETTAACPSFALVHADALAVSADDLSRPFGAPDALVANLPYQVAATVVLRFFERLPSLRQATVMVQAEVADRMAAVPGTKAYGGYTVKLRLLAKPAGRFAVAPGCFLPPPRVDSGCSSAILAPWTKEARLMDLVRQAEVVGRIRSYLEELTGTRIKVRANMGRSKIIEREGILTQTHPALFVVEVQEKRERTARASYQYVDVLTGTVELSDPDNGETLFPFLN